MPVIPHGIAPFTIKAPLTSTDPGQPTDNIFDDARRIFAFIEDERHLTALELHKSVMSRIMAWDKAHKRKGRLGSSSSSNNNKQHRSLFLGGGRHNRKNVTTEAALAAAAADQAHSDAKAFLKERHPQIVKLEHRCRIFKRALHNLKDASDWTLASSMFGVKTFYRREEDGSLSLKLEGELKDCPLFEQVCVLKEIDLHYKWAPFCTSSMTIADLDKLDTVGWFLIGLANFGLSRDGCFRVIGCDNILEDDSIIVAGQGIRDLPPGSPAPPDTYLCEDPILDKLDIPPIPTRRGGGRMTIRTFEAVIQVTSPTSARTRLVANIDPNMTFLPQPLLEFVMKNLAGVLLAKLQNAAKKVPRNPVSNEHARRMRDEEDFYRHWLMKKFQVVCEVKGWEMPPVTAFELTDEQLRKDHQLAEKRAQKDQHRRAVSFDLPEDSRSPSERGDFKRSMSAPEHSESNTYDGDGVSELSSKSSRSTPFSIAQAVKRREERKRQKKDEQIARERLKAAQRLQPKEFSPDKQKRLGELRSVKAARTGQDGATSTTASDPRTKSEPPQLSRDVPGSRALKHSESAPVPNTPRTLSTIASTPPPKKVTTTPPPHPALSRNKSVSEAVTDRLYRHTPVTRAVVLLLLTILLFILLHPKLLFSVMARTGVFAYWQDNTSLLSKGVHGVVAVVYLLICALAHFALCDIALVYAFDSMELGSKAGRRLRKFYSTQVRLGVALGSLGIFIIAICKSIFKIMLRYLSWAVLRATGYLAPFVPGFVGETFATACGLFNSVLGVLSGALNFVLQSNPVTGTIGNLTGRVVSSVASLWTAAESFMVESAAVVSGEIGATPWHEESFVLAKYLFSYSSVFLVTSLILFNLSAKQAATKAARNSIKASLLDSDDSTHASDVDSKSQARSRGPLGSDLSDIQEHPITITASTEEQQEVVSMTSTQKRKGLLRRRNT
mmetsp:Transcript_6128/g.12285  ORF Transcript_6128/g.12285 Transcript_6128/m.12285 type:complete len:951 (+) Transcript_6128:32-2884(+)